MYPWGYHRDYRLTYCGDPYEELVPNVPPVSYMIQNCVVYLYRTVEDAIDSEGEGASGFLVNMPWSDNSGRWHQAVITNRHVIDQGGLAVRVSRWATDQYGPTKVDAFLTERSNWRSHPNADVAIYPLDFNQGAFWDQTSIGVDLFLTPEQLIEWQIMPGDEIVVPARLIGYDGERRNATVLNSGMIARHPEEPVYNRETGQQEHAFLIETHSRGGYSGSPVFGYTSSRVPSLGVDRPVAERLFLIGVLWGHISFLDPVVDRTKKDNKGRFARTPYRTSIPSGISTVVPSWEIRHLCDQIREDVFMAVEREMDDKLTVPETMISTEPPDEVEIVSDFSDSDEPSGLARTADLMGKLIATPKGEADDVHQGHEE